MRSVIIGLAVVSLLVVTLAGVSRPKPRRVDALDQWRLDRDARKAGL